MTSYCLDCGHPRECHEAARCLVAINASAVCGAYHFLPTPTPTKDTAMNDSLPRVISFDELRENDLVEISNPEASPEWAVRGRVDAFDRDGDAYIPGHGYLLRGTRCTLRLLDRPTPALPTTPGTVIDCTLDGEPGAVLVLDSDGEWTGADGQGHYAEVTASKAHRITNWTVRPKPGAKS